MIEQIDVKPVFDRPRSGYVRDFKTFDVFVFNTIGFALGLALSTNPAFIGSFAPSSNIVAVLVLGAVLSVFNGLTYGWFGGVMPSTGGDYVFVGRSLNHRLGFLTSWGFTACQIYGMAMNLGWILSIGIAPAILTIGVAVDSVALVNFGVALGTPAYMACGSFLLLFLYFAFAYNDMGLNRYVIYTLFGLALLGPTLMLFVLFSHNTADFTSDYNSFMGRLFALLNKSGPTNDYYAFVTETAKQGGVTVDPAASWRASLQAMPLGFLCFIGFTYSVYVGGEVREPQKSQVRGILWSLALGFFVFVVGMGRYVDVVGQQFHSSVGFPAVGEKLGITLNSMNLFTGIMTQSLALNVIMQVGNLMWFVLVPYVMLQVCAHNVIAWSCDRLLPQQLLLRSGRSSAPWVSFLAICAVAAACIGANYFFGFTMVGAVALAAVAYFLTGIGALYLPKQRPDVFERAPGKLRVSFLGLTAFQIVGLVSAIGFAWIVYASVAYPEISGGTRLRAIVVLFVVYASGLVLYELRKAKLLRETTSKGVDLDALFREIPKD